MMHIKRMNKVERPAPLAGYEEDFARWSAEQAALLRAGRFDAVDLENVAEEIESLGRSDRREIRNRQEVLLRHLLKWEFQPDKRKAGWRSTILEQRRQIKLLIEESPSLQAYPVSQLAWCYGLARSKAADEAGLPESMFPEECPYEARQILDEAFLPGSPGGIEGPEAT